MGGSNSTTSHPDRANRFVQSVQDGIIVYSEEYVANFVAQFEAFRYSELNVLAQLEQDKLSDSNFKHFWDSAAAMYNLDPQKYRNAIKKKDGTDFPDECHIALICYTMGNQRSSVYAQFNSECRSVCGGVMQFTNMPNLSLFFLLRYVMENRTSIEKSAEPKVFYRGCDGKVSESDIKAHKKIGFGHFTSTSIKDSIGNGFGGSYGTVFEIRNESSEITKTIALESHSEFGYEKEYLLSPFQLYTLKSLEIKGDKTWVVLSLH